MSTVCAGPRGPRFRAGPSVAALLCLCLPGCGQAPDDSHGAWDGGAAWSVTEDLRIGSADESGPAQFGMIGDLVSGHDGRIYVLDIMAQEVRVFADDGRYLHSIGRRGHGPGEFAEAVGMSLGPGDTLWVQDPDAGRYSAFAPDGSFVRSVPRTSNLSNNVGAGFLRDGRYLDWGLAWPGEHPDWDDMRIVYRPILLSADLTRADSLPPLERVQHRAMIGNRMSSAVFFRGAISFDVDEQGDLWFAHPEGGNLYRRSLVGGDTLMALPIPGQAGPIGAAERALVRERVDAIAPHLTADYLAALPPVRPVVHRVFSDGAGHILVVIDVKGVEPGSAMAVFSVAGTYLGLLRLPHPLSLNRLGGVVGHVGADHMLLVVLDEQHVPYVSRLRIHRTPAGVRSAGDPGLVPAVES